MQRIRKKHSAEFKAKVALEALREARTAAEIGSQYAIHATQVAKWKKQALDGLSEIFSLGKGQEARAQDELVPKLYQQIGELKVELDWFKKKSGGSF
jgi:transposase-like protein